MLKERIINEQRELNKQWEKRREKGFFNYTIFGALKGIIFLCCAYFLNALIEKSFINFNFYAIVIASILIPICSWFGNETRYRFMNKK